MNNDQHSPSHGPKPLSPSAILKLLRAAGQGTRLELQPEHMAAFDAAIASLAFQHQVRQLFPHAPPSLDRQPSSREPRSPREDGRGTSLPSAGSRPAAAPRAGKVQPPRPTEGSGAIWTPEEESRLRSQWERDDAIGAIAEQHKRSPLACFSRLMRLGAVEPSPQAEAAMFLIKKQQLVQAGNAGSWLPNAAALGFEARPPEPAPAPAKPPAP